MMSLKNEHIVNKNVTENCLIILEQSKYNISWYLGVEKAIILPFAF